MGAQIALQAALHGVEARLHDLDPLQLDRAEQRNRTWVERRVAKGDLDASAGEAGLAGVRLERSLAVAVAGVDLAIEAAIEELEPKRTIFRELERLAPGDALLATNSSSMTVSEVAGDLATRERCLALHFFNPALVMRLVEIAPAPFSNPNAISRAVRFVELIDREPVVLQREIGGLLANRVLWALRSEAFWLAEHGYAEPQAIDRAVKLGLNHPMGPFELADMVGLDVVLSSQRHRFARTGDERDRPPALLQDRVAAGRLGRKSGAGFYEYDADGRAKA
jgi:3-hydroxybutyryl-CoA dehydrogenase